jgi:hypothetical protein
MSADGNVTITATQAKVERDGLAAFLHSEPGYVGRDAYWRVEVYPSAGRAISGTRETFEGAQALAVQMLDALARHRDAARAEREAEEALIKVASTQPEPAVVTVASGDRPFTDEPPF